MELHNQRAGFKPRTCEGYIYGTGHRTTWIPKAMQCEPRPCGNQFKEAICRPGGIRLDFGDIEDGADSMIPTMF